MELRQMKVFCTIVEMGSFRKASEALNLSQPSVSQYVAALEAEYNVKFFRRSGRGVALTPHGRAFHSLAKEVLHLSDLIPYHFSEMEHLQRGNLMIGTTHHIAEILLPGTVKDFKRSFPKINLSILTGNANRIITQVLDGQLEFGIIGKVLTRPTEVELSRLSLGFERLCMVTPCGHPWEGRGISPQELMKSELPLARYINDHPLGFLVDDYLLRNKIELRHDLLFNSVNLAAKFVADGGCLAIVSENVAKDHSQSGRLGIAFLNELEKVVWETELVFSKTRGISFAGWEMEKRIVENAKRIFRNSEAKNLYPMSSA